MGNFQAIKIETDDRVEFKDNVINVITINTTQTLTITDYYQSILKAALTTFKLKTDFKPKNEPEPTRNEKISSEFETSMKDFWGKECNFNDCLIGYILQDTHLSKDVDTLLARIADEENKYYWKWLEGDNEVKDSADNQTILNRLRIVNANLLNKIFVTFANSTGNKIGGKHWINNEKPLQDTTLIVPAIAISLEESYKNGTDLYYGVYVNPNARLLFLDNSEDTQRYKYGKKDGSNDYEIKRTYIYNNNVKKNVTVGVTTNESMAEYFLGKENEKYRYLIKLIEVVNKLNTKYGRDNVDRVATINPFLENNKKEDKLLQKIHFKTAENKDDVSRNQTEKDAAKALAHQAACELPKGNYHCFYHDNGGTLMGHISAVNISEGGRGSSGYPMRADRVNEVNYKWLINLPDGDANFPLAKLWSYLFELNPEFLVTSANRPKIQQNRTTNTSDAFYPTNWPYDKVKKDGFKNPVIGSINSLIQYYKTFNPSEPKRNKPLKDPFPPRVTNPSIPGYDYKFDIKEIEISVKLDNTGYRVWKKFNAVGEDLTLGVNENERVDAGKTMAEALSNFHVYPGMKASNITPKITDSKLSATSFAKYVLGQLNDNAVKEQWRKDNELNANATVDASSLKTDQEWCHLFGHGDGGPEELGNFVSGSKHCNTEQLAIETGQRRVSQNKTDFKEVERSKLKARITAYLIPNAGTWVTGVSYTQDKLNKTLLTGVTDHTVKNQQSEFFEKVPNVSPDEYRLKFKTNASGNIDDEALRTAFKKLSDAISDSATNLDKKKQLFQFRHNLEKHFFMYLPIARWMRYKLYYDGKKVFDHIYDAQSESINLHECQILDYMVERALYIAMGKESEYKQKIKSRVEKLLPSEEEAGIIGRVLDLDRKLNEIFNNLKSIDKFAEQIEQKISEIKGILANPNPNFANINLEQLEENCNMLQELLKNANTDIQSQITIYHKIAEDFKNMTVEQQNQSQLKLIIKDKDSVLLQNINYLTETIKKISEIQKNIATKIGVMKEELKKANPTMEVDSIGEQVESLKRQIKETKEETLPGDKKKRLKNQQSMVSNANKL
ncbi:hypothetical protein PN434_02375 [Microcystis aeruginosa CS-558/01A06]|uniref:Uncharacterized protein n=1 Tax=Microcystis aeruginosa BLCC-F108 TaxID=2755317 RepID=A0A841UJC6_MICAE|nr:MULTISPECIES: hypothetical protein [Microcystis]MBC1190235.1 hypothetical protein [Microcystis aeruginosa BLCC-F108]MCA2593190.1 hypothetical protein [Microcystis sp. M31BS1]MDB9407394.1 hypothetical protein [Microcystis aeruginosa CS-558/01A06]